MCGRVFRLTASDDWVLRELGLSSLEPLIVLVKADKTFESRIPLGARSLTLSPVRFGRPSVNQVSLRSAGALLVDPHKPFGCRIRDCYISIVYR